MVAVEFGHEVLNVPISVKGLVTCCGDLNEMSRIVDHLNT